MNLSLCTFFHPGDAHTAQQRHLWAFERKSLYFWKEGHYHHQGWSMKLKIFFSVRFTFPWKNRPSTTNTFRCFYKKNFIYFTLLHDISWEGLFVCAFILFFREMLKSRHTGWKENETKTGMLRQRAHSSSPRPSVKPSARPPSRAPRPQGTKRDW